MDQPPSAPALPAPRTWASQLDEALRTVHSLAPTNFRLLESRRANHCRETGSVPDWVFNAGPPVLIAAFDGPPDAGHLYNLWWHPERRVLEVADVDPTADLQATEDWAALLDALRVVYTKLPSLGRNRCADVALTDAAARCGYRPRPGSLPLAARATPLSVSDFERHAEPREGARLPRCGDCGYRACRCYDMLCEQEARLRLHRDLWDAGRPVDQTGHFFRPAQPQSRQGGYGCLANTTNTPSVPPNPLAMLLALQTLAGVWFPSAGLPAGSGTYCGTPSPLALLTAATAATCATSRGNPAGVSVNCNTMDSGEDDINEDIEADFAGGWFGDDPDDARRFADLPPVTTEAIRAELHRAAIGDVVEVIWRMSVSDVPDDVRMRVWYGRVVRQFGTTLRPSWEIEYYATQYGPLLADDDMTVTTERATLPVNPAQQREFQVLSLRLVKEPPPPIARPKPARPRASGGGGGDDGEESTSSDDEGIVPEHRGDSPAGQVSGYAYIEDAPQPLDLTLWPDVPTLPLESWPRTRDAVSGDDFLRFELLSLDDARARCPDIVWASVTNSVRKAHHSGLEDLRAFITDLDSDARRLPLDALLCFYLQKRRVDNKSKRRWRWSTVSRQASNVVAFMAALPVYCACGVAPVFSADVTRWPMFKALLTSSKREAVFQGAREPVAATNTDVTACVQRLRSTGDTQTAAVLLLCWFTAGRPGDVLQLLRDDISFTDGDRLTVRFRRSKVVKHIGEYVIHTRVPPAAAKIIMDAKARARSGGFLFPIANDKIRNKCITKLREALRSVRPELECRSLRRGTLQRLAKADATEEELLTFSRHTNAEQLRRYLGHGFVPHAAQRSAQGKAAALSEGFADMLGGDLDDAQRGAGAPIRLADWCHVTLDGHAIFSLNRSPELDARTKDRSHYRLHAKPEAAPGIDIPAVDAMADEASVPAAVRDGWHEDRRWLSDVTGLYAAVDWNGELRESTLSADEVGQLLAIGNVAAVSPEDAHKAKGTIFVFKTPEDAKARFRVIKHPKDFNDHYGPDTTRNRGNATRNSARESIIGAEGAIDFDLAAFFDQIPLDESATWYQVFKVRKAGLFRNLRKPMGGRHSTQTATSITRVLLAFPMPPGVTHHYATDNVRFTGPRAGVVDAAFTFALRCRRIRAALNDVDVSAPDHELRAAVQARFTTVDHDFLGEVATYGPNPTVRCRDKHVAKLAELYERIRCRDARCSELFGLYAMLLYMSSTLGIRLDTHLPTRLYFIELARVLARDVSLWEAPARGVALPGAFPAKDLEHWYHQAHANRPAHLFRAPPLDTVVFGDACVDGYAGILARRLAGGEWDVRLLQHRWDAAAKAGFALKDSVISEPLGAVRLLDESKNCTGVQHLRAVYVTDHEPFSYAHRKGYSPSPFYNARVGDLKDRHPAVELEWSAGSTMIADKYSRFLHDALLQEDRERAIDEANAILAARNAGRPCIVGTWEGASAAAAASTSPAGGPTRR